MALPIIETGLLDIISENNYESWEETVPLYCDTLFDEKMIWEKWILQKYLDKDCVSNIIKPESKEIGKINISLDKTHRVQLKLYTIIPKIFLANSEKSRQKLFYIYGIPKQYIPTRIIKLCSPIYSLNGEFRIGIVTINPDGCLKCDITCFSNDPSYSFSSHGYYSR
jgi:hypothetical protein